MPPVAEQEQFGLSFDEASANADAMTDLQFDTWAADFIGTEVGWHGQVEDADTATFDENEFRVVVDPRGGGSLERANLIVSRELALAIPRDQQVFFTGTISEIRNSFGLTIEVADVEIQDPASNTFQPIATEPPAGAVSDVSAASEVAQ